MDEILEKAVGRVIETMRDNLGEQLSIDDMARTALFSKFHFTRIFQRVTGVSPGRFLWAMRLQKAKELLVSTSLNVTDISHCVGYGSVGTFSTRFSSTVGVSPSTYRRLGGYVPRIDTEEQHHAPERLSPTVKGQVWSTTTDDPGLIFVGLFADRMPQGRPAKCTVLTQPGPLVLENVPQGTWYLMAHSIAVERDETSLRPIAGDQSLSVGVLGPIKVRQDTAELGELQLRPVSRLDPPVLLAPLDVRSLSVPAA